MSLPQNSVKRPVAVSMFYIALAVLGIYAFSKTGVDFLPDINKPHLMVQTENLNASAEEIEEMITKPLESQIASINGVKNISSISKEGVSLISVDFTYGTNMDYSFLALREKLDNTALTLPKEAKRPNILRTDPSSLPVMSLALSERNPKTSANRFIEPHSDSSEINKLIRLKDNASVIFKRRLEQIEGLAMAAVAGGLEREIAVFADPEKVNMNGLQYDQITEALKKANINVSSGSVLKGFFRYNLRTLGEFENIHDIENTVVKRNKNGSAILVKDIAEVKESFKERQGLTRLNGNEVVSLFVYKEPEANTVEIAKAVRKLTTELNEKYPEYELKIVSDQSGFIEDSIANIRQEIFYGGILAVLVLFFFLGSIRNVLIIGITIPASLVITTLLLYISGVSFNIISLGGIALGIGMLMDNAIIVIENISSHSEKNSNLIVSTVKATNEVAMPIVAATLTTAAVFLPLIFVKGVAGYIFADQSKAVIFSLASSIITALTLVPMLASRQIRRKQGGNSASLNKFLKQIYLISNGLLDKIIVKYETLLHWALENNKQVLIGSCVLILITMFAVYDMKKEFIPANEENEFVLEISYPEGFSLKGNAEATSGFEKKFAELDGVDILVSNIGIVNEFDFQNKEQLSVNKTNIYIKLQDEAYYKDAAGQIRKALEKSGFSYRIKPVESVFSKLIKPSENDIEIKIQMEDQNAASEMADQLIELLKKKNIEGLTEVRKGTEKLSDLFAVQINREKCNTYGVDPGEVATFLSERIKGTEATSFSDFEKRIPVRIVLPENNRQSLTKLLELHYADGEKSILLKNLVDYRRASEQNEIRREGQSRTTYVFAGLNGISVDKAVEGINEVIKEIKTDNDELITVGGANDEIRESFAELYLAIIISILLMYMVLASEFESFLYPFIIIFSIPMGLVGGILLLYVFGESISIISLTGLLILVGIADNDAVVKVEFILRKRKEGLGIKEAIIEAGKDRFRPIVMNSLTVIFGLMPMIFGLGAGTQMRVSLAIAIAGGLVSATFLTLIVIPVIYLNLEKWAGKTENRNA